MIVRLYGDLRRAAGQPETRIALEAPMRVREVLTVLRSMYPGAGRYLEAGGDGLVIRCNQAAADLDTPVADADLLEIRG